jgi:hypothetical protein
MFVDIYLLMLVSAVGTRRAELAPSNVEQREQLLMIITNRRGKSRRETAVAGSSPHSPAQR